MPSRRFTQVDVFSAQPLRGNPLAVVIDAEGLSDAEMQAFARWTNLSETTFLLSPVDPAADYRVRIFTPGGELPFAGHPTLGSAHAWLEAGGVPRREGVIVQECGIGLVEVSRESGGTGDDDTATDARLAFTAPPLLRSGPAEPALAASLTAALGVEPSAVRAVEHVDNGAGFIAVLLDDAREVLALTPDFAAIGAHKVGVVAPWREGGPTGADSADGGPADVEVRGFVPGAGIPEDPVTGSLNAGIASWFRASGIVEGGYIAAQGTVLGRAGRVRVRHEGERILIGGSTVTVISGAVEL